MKIIVSHPGKQHSPALLRALQKKGFLRRFYTLIAANRFPIRLQALRKRDFAGVNPKFIRHFPLYWAISYFGKWDLYQTVYRWFDRQVAKRLKRIDFDLLIGYENANLESFKLAKQLGKTTLLDLAAVHHQHYENLFVQYPAYRSILPHEAYFLDLNRYKTKALQYTDHCFCLSSYARQTLIEGGLRPEQIHIVNLGTNLQLFNSKPVYPTSFENGLRVLFVGRMSALKGIPELLDLFRSLAGQHPLILELVGPKNPGEDLLQNLPGNVQYTPFLAQEELVAKYQNADVFINFSYTDSWAQTVIEAMACGTPAIVTEHTGAKDAVAKGGGWIVPVKEISPLKNLLLKLLQNSQTVEKKGKAAHAIAQDYSWENYYNKVLATLKKVHKN